ncbi:MAG: DsrE family protein [Myxococcota bacterium]|nr:DsrE family protein [Myxococcota bacterium]
MLWYDDDRFVAERVCLMYAHNAKIMNWFDVVELIIWGPSQRLLTEDQELQDTVTEMINDGVIVEACRACADLYGVTNELEALGITVKYMGEPLTEMIQSDWQVLTF